MDRREPRTQQVERRKDAVLAREIELALPRELSQAETIALARDFVRKQFVTRGMVDLTDGVDHLNQSVRTLMHHDLFCASSS